MLIFKFEILINFGLIPSINDLFSASNITQIGIHGYDSLDVILIPPPFICMVESYLIYASSCKKKK